MTQLRFCLPAAVVIAACSQTHPAAARDAIVLLPSSSWHLDYADDKCALKRDFTDGVDDLRLQIEQSGLAPYYNLGLFGDPVDRAQGELIEVQFGPNEEATERSFIDGDLEQSEMPFILMHGIHLAPASDDVKSGEFVVVDIGPEREAAITNLSLSRGLRTPIRLELGSMGEPLAAMRTCVADLVQSLHLDEEGANEVVVSPRPKNDKELTRFILDRFPTRMVRQGEGGTVRVRMVVNREGRPTSCQIAKSDRPAVFDDYVCFGMLRIAEFEPAIGPDGEPRHGVYTTSVTFKVD